MIHKKRIIITSVISIILVSILMIGSTYSIFTSSDIDEDLNVYKTGTLGVTYTLSSDNVTLTSSTPKNIDDADSVVPIRITVTNSNTDTNAVPYMFDVILEDTTASNVIDYQYIMTKVGYLEPKSLKSCSNNVIKEDVIVFPGESVDIDVRVWISDTISNSEIGKSFYSKLKIDGIAIYDKNEEFDNSVLALNYMKGFSGDNDTSYFHSSTYLNTIKNVSIVDYIDTSNQVESWDMSEKGDSSIVAWVTNNETSGYYDLFIGSKHEIFAKDLKFFFEDMMYIDNMDLTNLNTALTTDMVSLFNSTGEKSTTFTLDLGEKFNTLNVIDMGGVFYRCGYNSTSFSLNLGEKFDTSNAINMEFMFSYTGHSSTVFTLDLGEKFDTSNVTNMLAMFQETGYNSTVFTLDLGEKFDTSSVTNMQNMFFNTGRNSTVFTLNLGEKFNTSSVTNMRYLFWCTGYSSTVFTLDIGKKFDTSSVTDMSYMFGPVGYNSTVFTLNLGEKFDTSNVTDMNNMFLETGHANTSFTLSLGDKFNTSSVTNMSYMFQETGYSSTSFTLDFGEKFDTSSVTNMTSMFYYTGHDNSNLELDLSTFDFTNVTSYVSMFGEFSSTKKIYVKDSADQAWILDKGFSELSSSNVLIKS